MLGVYYVKERSGTRREAVVRAHSPSDTADLLAVVIGLASRELQDTRFFTIEEVNFGDGFLNAGRRGVIALF